MKRSTIRSVSAGLAALLLAGCGGGATPPTAEPSVGLASLRAEADLPDCPATDPTVAAVPGGLPQTELNCLGTDQSVNLADLPREPTVVNLWAQWCEPCRAESPYLREVFESSDRVQFVGVNYQDPQTDWAIEFAGLVGWRYPHVADPEKELQAPLNVPGLPLTLFVDGTGMIVYRHVGQIESAQQLRDLISEHLEAN